VNPRLTAARCRLRFALRNGRTVTIPAVVAARLLRPTTGGTWAETAAVMAADPHEKALVDELTRQLRAAGQFSQPVIVGHRSVVVDGTHRMCAHLATGIPVRAAGDWRHDPLPEIELTFTVEAAADGDALFDTVVGTVRSFPVPGSGWANCDAFTANLAARAFTGVWYSPVPAAQLAQHITRRLEEHAAVTVTSITAAAHLPDPESEQH